jgi:tryptophan-rich sensory protein
MIIGLGYYAVFFTILLRLLTSRDGAVRAVSLGLSVVLFAANAAWNYLFFRKKNVRAAQLFSVAYSAVAVVLLVLLMRTDSFSATLLSLYVVYLIFANHWQYKLWLANR